MKRSFVMMIVVCMCVMLSCQRHNKVDDRRSDNTAQSIETASVLQSENIQKIQQANTASKTAVATIRTETEQSNLAANSIGTKTQDASIRNDVTAIVNHNQKIRESADTIDKNSETISVNVDAAGKHNQQINKDAAAVADLQKKVVELENQKQQLENEAIKNLYTTLSFFFGLGFVTIIAGLVMAFLVNRKLGYTIAAVGLMGLAAAAGAIYYLKTIAIVSIVVIIAAIVLCVVLGVWYAIRESTEKKDLEQANVENVQLVQTIKNRLDPTAKVEIFGETREGIVQKIQSDKTRKIVRRVKDKIEPKGEIK